MPDISKDTTKETPIRKPLGYHDFLISTDK